MKRILSLIPATLTLLGLAGLAPAATVDFTIGGPSPEDYVAGAQLNSHSNWIAQATWTSEAVGDGVAQNTTGPFVRANFRGESFGNTVGDSFIVGATFILLGDADAHTGNLQDFEESAFILNATETNQANPLGSLGAALALEDDLDPDELQLRLMNNASGSINLGPASNFTGHTFTLLLECTRLDATNYIVTASVDSLDDAAPPFEVTDPSATVTGAFSSATAVYGFLQSVPAAIDPYSGVQVDQFTFEAPEPDIIPSTPVVAGGRPAVDAFHFLVGTNSVLQRATTLTGADWEDVPGTLTPPTGDGLLRYLDDSGIVYPDVYYRVIEILGP